mmetsp:Transcript_1315/g.5628  ORF Transcript_1315/g.5628 Transcript_1315/m.5628 type:complete len:304 (-) Transcript_1315:1438-2349(-)|eukprot:scaffold501_cov355-Pinguiococcus_pyrenoidosus.AAC.17
MRAWSSDPALRPTKVYAEHFSASVNPSMRHLISGILIPRRLWPSTSLSGSSDCFSFALCARIRFLSCEPRVPKSTFSTDTRCASAMLRHRSPSGLKKFLVTPEPWLTCWLQPRSRPSAVMGSQYVFIGCPSRPMYTASDTAPLDFVASRSPLSLKGREHLTHRHELPRFRLPTPCSAATHCEWYSSPQTAQVMTLSAALLPPPGALGPVACVSLPQAMQPVSSGLKRRSHRHSVHAPLGGSTGPSPTRITLASGTLTTQWENSSSNIAAIRAASACRSDPSALYVMQLVKISLTSSAKSYSVG